MPSLSKELRRLLEKTIAGENGARQIAELGAEQSLQRLAVDRHEPHTSLTPEERTLRTQLRAHGRQLGDKRDLQRGSQSINHLTQAVAYEHWHRLLFARFLAENDLLMHPEHGVALSLNEVKELALGLGRDWIDVASEYAQRMLLREVFRSDDPALKVPLSPERRLELEKKLNLLPSAIFLADDSLGWVYQFWQKDAKDQVNRSEVKIGADELAPVTQLFTEDYMVLFLLENTLGAWWTARRGAADLPGYSWTYLRLNEDGAPAASGYERWPKSARELKLLDPSMGSGHFLTFALPILARMRETEEGLSISEASAAVLRDNLFGLELDPRCSQIAAFNLALTAWKLANRHFDLPPLNLACSGLGPNTSKEQWIKLGEEIAAQGGMPGGDLLTTNDSLLFEPVKRTMESLHDLFSLAPILGSLISPATVVGNLFQAGYKVVAPLLASVLEGQNATEEMRERVIAAAGMVKAAELLGNQYTLVATNVPYLGRLKQHEILREYCDKTHPDAKADLATCFIERCLAFCDQDHGSVALVSPQLWFFLKTFATFRRKLISQSEWNAVVALGEEAWWTFGMRGPRTVLTVLSAVKPDRTNKFLAIDVSTNRGTTPILLEEKVARLSGNGLTRILLVNQELQLGNPDSCIVFEPSKQTTLLSSYAESLQGAATLDIEQFRLMFFEIQDRSGWNYHQSSPLGGVMYSGAHYISADRSRGGRFYETAELLALEKRSGAPFAGKKAWGKLGIACAWMGYLPSAIYLGAVFDNSIAVIVPKHDDDLLAIWCFCSSKEFVAEVRKINQKNQVANATLVNVPFDIDRWRKIATSRFPDGLPAPQTTDPAQWIFTGHPEQSDAPLQVGVIRLLGYKWPRQIGSSFPNCMALTPDGLDAHSVLDGIVCLSSVAGEESAGTLLRVLLQSAFGEKYNLAQLLAGKRSATLEGWLRDEFFEEHCEAFHQRPFIWHVWDGLKDGFHALVNYHKLDRRNLEKLIYSYLGDWLTRQRQDVQNGVEGADTRVAAAEHLQEELIRIADGETPFDIFVRWKSLGQQPIGWEPDLNDGVRINIRPWITEAKLYKASKPGILRVIPNIKYTKDRGKEPKREPNLFPWFEVSTERINDHHLSLAEKRSARGLR